MTSLERMRVQTKASAYFPGEWLDPRAGSPACDLDLALLLVNSHDTLDDPPDRLLDLRWLRAVLIDVGHAALAAELVDDDLGALRTLRAGLRRAFEATDADDAALVLNPMMTAALAVPLLVTRPAPPDGAPATVLAVGVGRSGLAGLQARLPVAVAQHIVGFGVSRLGTCASDPCHCAFVDRTRAGTKRYCCGWCNDRAAARAYRRRRKMGIKS